MALSLSTMRTRVKNNVNELTTDNDTKIDADINDALDDIMGELEHDVETSATFSTVASTAGYVNLPADLWKFTRVLYDTDPLKEVTFEDLDRVDFDYTDEGDPKYYIVYGTTFYLYPIPDAVTTVTRYYRKNLTDLSSDGDEPAFVDKYHVLLVYYATAEYLRREKKYGDAEYWQQRYERGKLQMTWDLIPEDEPQRVIPKW